MNCIICNGQQLKLLRKAVRDDPNTSVVRCLRCGHYQLYPLPKESELEKFYNEDGQVKSLFSDEVKIHDIRMKVSTDIMRRAEYVKKIVGDQKNKQILDIGTGYGFFVEHMEKQGYKIEGIEIGRARREVAERICFSPIYSYNLVDELPDKMVSRYDIIVLFQVLEHIVSVNTFLKNIYKMMTKDAVLIIEVPNVDDHMLKISSSYNNFFWQKAHVSYFSSETLRKVLIQCGFNNINIHGVQRYSIKNSMNWLLNGKPQLKNPSYIIESELSWIDNYYKNKLSESLKSDTLLATVRI